MAARGRLNDDENAQLGDVIDSVQGDAAATAKPQLYRTVQLRERADQVADQAAPATSPNTPFGFAATLES